MRQRGLQSRRHAPSDSQESPRPLPAPASAPTFQRPLETARGGLKMANKISALTYQITSGTDRFAGIKGSGSYTCKSYSGKGYFDWTETYTLP